MCSRLEMHNAVLLAEAIQGRPDRTVKFQFVKREWLISSGAPSSSFLFGGEGVADERWNVRSPCGWRR